MNGHDSAETTPAARTPAEILIENEHGKLTATRANGLAVAIFAVGGFAPLVAATIAAAPFGTNMLQIASPSVFIVNGVCWSAGAGRHVLARWSLRKPVA